MLSLEDRAICKDVADKLRAKAFINNKDGYNMLRIIKRLDDAGEELKKHFSKMAIDLEESYNKRLREMQ